MAQPSVGPTDDPEINAVLSEVLSGARGILGDHFVGMYLDGSLAIGGFEPDKSDLDFVVVSSADVSADTFAALKTMHDRIASGASKWARELEGSYISQHALRHDRRPAVHPYIDRGSRLAMVHQESGYWPIHRYVLREHGVALAGPLPRTLIDPVSPEELGEAVRGILREWWKPMLVDGPLLRDSFYRCYAGFTMSRMLYTIRHGAIVTKLIAARWVQETVDSRWTPLIRSALASTRIMGSSVRASWPTRSFAPTAMPPIRRKSAGAWARSVPETGTAMHARSTKQTQKTHRRQRGA